MNRGQGVDHIDEIGIRMTLERMENDNWERR